MGVAERRTKAEAALAEELPGWTLEPRFHKGLLWAGKRQTLFFYDAHEADQQRVVCAGPFLDLGEGISQEEVAALPKKTSQRRLMNLMVGRWLAEQAEGVRVDEAFLTKALRAGPDSLGVVAYRMTSGVEHLGSTAAMGLPTEHVELTLHEVERSLTLDGYTFVQAQATLDHDLTQGGTDAGYSGTVSSRQRFVFIVGAGVFRAVCVLPRSVSFTSDPLAHVVGCVFGPCVIANRWQSQHWRDL